MNNSIKERIHLVIRISPTVRIKWDSLNVIAEHNGALAERGRVAFGKFGAVLGPGNLEVLKKAVTGGSRPMLYVVSKVVNGFAAVRSEIQDLQLGDNPFPKTYPGYYDRLTVKPKMWLLLTGPLESCSLEKLRLKTNDRPLLEVLNECRTTMMLVRASN